MPEVPPSAPQSSAPDGFPRSHRTAVLVYALVVLITAPVCEALVGRYTGHTLRIRTWMAHSALVLLAGHAVFLLFCAWGARQLRSATLMLGLAAGCCLVQAALTVQWTNQPLVARGGEVALLTMLGTAPALLRSGAWTLVALQAARHRRPAVATAFGDLVLIAAAIVTADQALMPTLHPWQSMPWGMGPFALAAVGLIVQVPRAAR